MVYNINEEYNLNLPGERLVLVPARLKKRLFSFLIDFFILEVFVFSVLAKPFERYFSSGLLNILESFNQIPAGLLLIFIASASLLSIIYFSFFDHYLGGSPGKLFVGIRVSSPNLLASFVRNISTIFIFPFNWFFVIDLYFLLTRKYRLLEKFSESYSYEILRI